MQKNIWPIGIAAFLLVFACGLVFFVMAALRKPDHLVRADYYEHEITYQQHIERELRAAGVSTGEVARVVPGTGLVITLPPTASNGMVEIFRPSDASLDRREPYAPGPDGRHVVAVTNLLPGRWRVRLAWLQDGHACYRETLIQVTP